MATLDKFFVSLGIKGQEVVLKNIDKVKKEATKLSKLDAVLNLGKGKIAKAISPAAIAKKEQATEKPSKEQATEKPSKEQADQFKKEDNAQVKNTNRFIRGAQKFGEATKSFASAASTLNPVSAIQSLTSATAKIAGGWSAFGFSVGNTIEGLGDLMNSGIAMADSAVQSAKQSASEQWGLSQRNTTVKYYGGDMANAEKAEISNPEYAQLINQVSGSFGRLKKPLNDLVTELAKEKDTTALGQVAAGNFESTGTDKGWFMQKIANSMGDLPPSMRQAIMTPMIQKMAPEIMGKEGQTGQKAVADWTRADEKQIAELYKVTNANEDYVKNLIGLNEKFNLIQIKLTQSGAGLAACVDRMANSINGAINKIKSSMDK